MSALYDTDTPTPPLAAGGGAAATAATAATLSTAVSPTEARLRVVLLLDVRPGAEQRFLRAYEALRHQVASVPGHVSDQLCQSIENPSKWLITSEWESADPFLSWVDSEEHREMVKPLHGCVEDTRSLRFSILRETAVARDAAPARGRLQTAPRIGDGVVRHALTFTVKPGSEREVARILADYDPPEARVDDTTRLCRTSLFLSGNRVVRAVEVRGDLVAALRHVARQPQVRAVEEAINPHLQEARDLDDPESARAFFLRAALPAVHHLAPGGARTAGVTRHALLYPVRSGCGAAVARFLARQDELAAEKAGSPLAASTVYQRDDIVMRMVDLHGPLDERPALAAGVGGRRAAAVFGRLVDLTPYGGQSDPADEDGLRRFLADCAMEPITDRVAPGC
ncbi:SchA/CurD-like domain-containing protein [Streptomyces sp. B1866]|uniref:SchA/CurD-like domain-containing protein n=1 Tax=Streptomyces sp. B1866 TaxID=3075431 RepID=UPI00288EFD83|nr:SchA/CurD-like domain-containing protein [Streptomyces sp. B1866]MDT3398000.1 SchA/CurD-like domain-containing protein [Streptomyces sp. B1866]